MSEQNSTKKLKVMDLFSGIGGFSLGLDRTGGFETVCFAEIDPFCQKVLNKHWPDVPIYNDVRTLEYDGAVDVITGGYPCQPFSCAGRRKGADDDRHLWPSMLHLIQKHRPTWVIGENVAGHITMGLDEVLSDLGDNGYGARAFIIPAVSVDARHRRDRVWIIANSNSVRRDNGCDNRGERQLLPNFNWDAEESEPEREGRERGVGEAGADVADTDNKPDPTVRGECEDASSEGIGRSNDGSGSDADAKWQKSVFEAGKNTGDVSDTTSLGQQRQGKPLIGRSTAQDGKGQADKTFSEREFREWAVEPCVGRVANGIPDRMDRLKSLGNSVISQIIEEIGHAILASMEQTP